jgi:hypothetical protein
MFSILSRKLFTLKLQVSPKCSVSENAEDELYDILS